MARERIMVENLKSGDAIDQLFLLRFKALRAARTGALYMALELADRSGKIEGRMWDASQQVFDSFQPEDFVRVRGRVESYKNILQVVVQSIEPRLNSEADVADFLPATKKDVEQMFARILEIAGMIQQPGLRALLDTFLLDKETAAKFKKAPAAVEYHHAWIGGLLEHTLGVTELGVRLVDLYPDLDRDLLLTGCILHDIGKIEEFSYDRGFHYTDSGELLGHLFIGARMVEQRGAAIKELSPKTIESLAHLILSHHGEYEYQSPKLPMTAEAMAVHHMDNLDAKINAFRSAMLRDRDPESRWTEFNRMFERRLFKGHAAD